jgi:ubiquinone/menaquinone biosynthesis C-methylase UbiE
MTTTDLRSQVRLFWNRTPCGSLETTAPEGTLAYYREVEGRRYQLEPFIARYAAFDSTRDQSVLEIGVGLGTDHAQFARAGARLTGVDLTERSIELAANRFRLEKLQSELQVADAESLPFADETFDVVYSWGVLHHSPNTPRAISEAVRVLRRGGRICLMVYSRHAWVTYGLWFRHAPLGGKPFRSLRDVLYHHMESPGTKGYTKSELRRMLRHAGLPDPQVEKVLTPYDVEYAGGAARLTGSRLGFFMVGRGVKPA